MKEIDIAVEWWAEKLRTHCVHNTGGMSMADTMATLVSQTLGLMPEEKVIAFSFALRNIISDFFKQKNRRHFLELRVDYWAEDKLKDAMEEVGYNDKNLPYRFPRKTVMHIGEGFVKVREGYGAETKILFEKK